MAEGELFDSLRQFGEEHLMCSICCDFYRNPKSLSCLHSFCEECLVTYAKSHKRNLKCPVCQQITIIPWGGVRKLPADFKLASMVDTVKQEQKQVVPTCSIHAGKRCGVYCATCNRVICLTCLTKSHSLHEVGDIPEIVAATKKQFVEDFMPLYTESLHKIYEALETVSGLKQDWQTTFWRIREEIEGKARQESDRLNAAKHRILSEIKQIHMKKEKCYNGYTDELTSTKELLEEAIKYSTSAVKSCDYGYLRRYPKLGTSFRDLIGRQIPQVACVVSPASFEPSPADGEISLGSLSTCPERVTMIQLVEDEDEGDSDSGDDGVDSSGVSDIDLDADEFNNGGGHTSDDHESDDESTSLGNRGRPRSLARRLADYISAALFSPIF